MFTLFAMKTLVETVVGVLFIAGFVVSGLAAVVWLVMVVL